MSWRKPHLQPGRSLEVDAKQHLFCRVSVQEVEPQALRCRASEVDRVALSGPHSNPEGHESLQTCVRKAPAARVTFTTPTQAAQEQLNARLALQAHAPFYVKIF